MITIALCAPEEPGNIGAACRAMKNFGFTSLALVGASDRVLSHKNTIEARALHACDVWESAKRYDSLSSFAASQSLLIGTTRRRGQFRKEMTLSPRELAGFLAHHERGSIALVFGNERTGLSTEELDICNMASHIPSHPECPSLNLSHAVQIYCYELSLVLNPALPPKGAWHPVDQGALTPLIESITESLHSLGFYKQKGREAQEKFFHNVLARASLSEKEAEYLRGIFAKAARLGLYGPKSSHHLLP